MPRDLLSLLEQEELDATDWYPGARVRFVPSEQLQD
jgi:hypothetical protein